jgi:hypothetical protein
MIQAQFSLTSEHLRLLTGYKTLGFKDKSDRVRTALNEFEQRLLQQPVEQSAELYTEIYQADEDIQAFNCRWFTHTSCRLAGPRRKSAWAVRGVANASH